MSVLLSLPVLWSQVLLPGVPERWRAVMLWLLLLGEPAFTQPGLIGGLITVFVAVLVIAALAFRGPRQPLPPPPE